MNSNDRKDLPARKQSLKIRRQDQDRAIAALLATTSIEAAGEECGVDPSTLKQWTKHPAFQAAYAAATTAHLERKRTLLVLTQPPGQTRARAYAEMAMDPLHGAAALVGQFAKGNRGDLPDPLPLMETVDVLADQARRVHGGDLRSVETRLVAHAAVLDGLFLAMTGRAMANLVPTGSREAVDRYFRLALKAQAQCRATIETLGAIKNPPAVFARQANIANGPQQINNNQALIAQSEPLARTEASVPTNKLLEAGHGSARVDAGTTAAAIDGDTTLETVAAVDGTAIPRGQSPIRAERRQRRRLARTPRAHEGLECGSESAARRDHGTARVDRAA